MNAIGHAVFLVVLLAGCELPPPYIGPNYCDKHGGLVKFYNVGIQSTKHLYCADGAMGWKE